MRKNVGLSVVALLLCFLLGYAAVQTAFLLGEWIAGELNTCRSSRNSNCKETRDTRERIVQGSE